MSEDHFDIAWVNYEKAILWGSRADDTQIERVLTDAERERVWAMNAKHEAAMNRLLRELAAVQ